MTGPSNTGPIPGKQGQGQSTFDGILNIGTNKNPKLLRAWGLYLAEGQRFELWELLHSTVFKTVALNHSAILPMGADINGTVMKCLSF